MIIYKLDKTTWLASWVLNTGQFSIPSSPFSNSTAPAPSEGPPIPLALSSQFPLPATSTLQNLEASGVPKGSVWGPFFVRSDRWAEIWSISKSQSHEGCGTDFIQFCDIKYHPYVVISKSCQEVQEDVFTPHFPLLHKGNLLIPLAFIQQSPEPASMESALIHVSSLLAWATIMACNLTDISVWLLTPSSTQ